MRAPILAALFLGISAAATVQTAARPMFAGPHQGAGSSHVLWDADVIVREVLQRRHHHSSCTREPVTFVSRATVPCSPH